jgi:Activator of Hsp90 ATPase, N-terminal
MARWGEGDERWIVSDRPDGTNVNGWHWVRVLIGRFQKRLHTGRARTAPPPLECFSPGVIRRRTGSCLLFVVVTDLVAPAACGLWHTARAPLFPQEERNCLGAVRSACDTRLPGLGVGDASTGWAKITAVKDVKGEVCAGQLYWPVSLGVTPPTTTPLVLDADASAPLLLGLRQASLCTRKGGKKLAVYDLQVTLSWEGFDPEEEAVVKGEWKLTEFASANEEDEFAVAVTVEGKGAGKERCKRAAQGLQPEILRHLLDIMSTLMNG